MKKTYINLIPKTKNPSPDYYCTWQTQLYATSDGKPPMQRQIIGEDALFNREKPFGWAYFYEKIRSDLILVMDDSWDVPKNNDESYYGSLVLAKDKFSNSYIGAKSNTEALKNLCDKIKSIGWKGLGGWVYAGESERYMNNESVEEYWEKRLNDADKAGFCYWKIDWGKKGKNIDFRRNLTDKAKALAPNLVIEHAFIKDIIPSSDVFRTYDVPAILSIPLTMKKIREFSEGIIPNENYMGLINCEDEAYIAAAGGFSMGIMRHEYSGNFPNGKKDMAFPEAHRDIKTKISEIICAVRWHKIAPAFSTDCRDIKIDENLLCDYWRFDKISDEIEAWWLKSPLVNYNAQENTVSASAPARISRGCALPEIIADEKGNVPFVIASKNPNGAFSIATLGRTLERRYYIPKCDVYFDIENAETVGVFGDYKNLILKTCRKGFTKILLQSLADDIAYDITDECIFGENTVCISGEAIDKICAISRPLGDTSENGAVVKII